jgi:inositol-pentakisphosphate 2-kinase
VDLRDALAARLMPLLYVSPVLPALSRLQRTLDALDIEGVSALVQPAFHAASTAGSEYSDDEDEEEPENPLRPVSLEEWVAFRRRWQKDTRDGSVSPLDTVPDEDDVRHHVLAALLAGTFKDCSLLVRVPLAATATATTTSSSDPPPIALVDLDPKRPGKLPRWAALDERLAAAYSLLPPEERKTCVDGRAAPFPPVPEREGSVGRGIRRRRRNGGKDGGDDEEAWGALEVGTLPYLLGITALVAAGAIVPRLL